MKELEFINSLIFYGFAALILLFAFLSIFATRIMYSLLAAIVVFFAVAGAFFLLGAQYNAVIQIAVYGIAVPILFIFAIMFTADALDKQIYITLKPRFFFAFIAAGLLFLAFVYLVATAILLSPVSEWILTKQILAFNQYQMFNALSNGIFINYVLAFELISLLLLIVIVGISTLNIIKEKKHD